MPFIPAKVRHQRESGHPHPLGSHLHLVLYIFFSDATDLRRYLRKPFHCIPLEIKASHQQNPCILNLVLCLCFLVLTEAWPFWEDIASPATLSSSWFSLSPNSLDYGAQVEKMFSLPIIMPLHLHKTPSFKSCHQTILPTTHSWLLSSTNL